MRCTTALLLRPFCLWRRGRGWALLIMAACICSPFSATGQDSPPPNVAVPAPAATKPTDVSKEALVFDKLYTRVHMESEGTGTRETTAQIRILADAGVKAMAVLTFTFTASNQQVDIGYVRVRKPDGTVVKTPDYNIQDMPADVTRQAPMYSDIHQKHVAVKGLAVGDILEYQTTIRTLKPEVPGQFWMEYSFEKNLIVLDEQLDLDLPADKAITVASADQKPTVTTTNGRKLYHWAASNLARPDPDAPPKSTRHWKPSVQMTTFTSWEQVGAWYSSLQRDSLTVTPAIQSKADALTKGLKSNDEKLHAIFNDVALHIHYVGLEFGIGRYQPHAADDVLSNEYGDCKDKHTLLAALLKAAGIEAWPVLISTARELDAATPSPAQFNHVITLVLLDGKLLWMDSTEEVAPVGLLIDPLRDKQALAVPNSKPAYLERTAEDSPFPRSIRLQVEGKLSDKGLFTGHMALTTDGDVGMLYRSAFRMVPQSQWKESLQGVSNAMGFGGEVSNPQVSEVEQIGQPLKFSYDYTREKYNQWNDKDTSHWISPPLPSIGGELAPGVKEKKPADEPELGSKGETTYHAAMELPNGWTMTVPQNVDLKEDWIEYHAAYSFKDGVFTADRVARIKKTKVPLEDWEKYLALRRAMFEDMNHQTLISPPGPGTSQFIPNGRTGASPAFIQSRSNIAFNKDTMAQMVEILRPLRDAAAILVTDPPPNAEDLTKAMDLMRKGVDAAEAKTLTLPGEDPNSLQWAILFDYAWAMRGWVALKTGDLATAESSLRAAWKLNHSQVSGYLLGQLLEAKGEKAAAAHQYEFAKLGSSNYLDQAIYSSFNVQDRIAESYQKLTGKPMTATSLNQGKYNGSLLAELDKETTFRSFTPTSKFTGEVFFTLAYEADKPAKAHLIEGDKKFASLAATLEARKLGGLMPASSKARLLREVRLMCSEYGGGCDAYLLSPWAIHIPGDTIYGKAIQVAPQGSKTIQVKELPVQAQPQ